MTLEPTPRLEADSMAPAVVVAGGVDGLHDGVEAGVDFVAGPCESEGVLAHFEA